MSRATRWHPLVMLLVLSLALAAPLAAEELDAPQTSTTFAFEAPRTTKGALALRVRFDFGEEQRCRFRVVASGTTRRPPILMWDESNGRVGALSSSYTFQAHANAAGQSFDSRPIIGPGSLWSIELITEGPFSGALDYRLVVFDASAWENEATGYHAPALIDVACADAFSVGGYEVGREAVGFKADSLSGGTGASVYQIIGSANINRGDGLTAAFTSPSVRFRYSGRKAAESVVEGSVSLDGPTGLRSWRLDGDDQITLDDGPGEYELELTRRAVGTYDSVLGALYGLAPATSLEDGLRGT